MHSGKAKESATKTAEKKGLRIYSITSLFEHIVSVRSLFSHQVLSGTFRYRDI